MFNEEHIQKLLEQILQRYLSYIKTSFSFSDPNLRKTFREALEKEGALMKGPILEMQSDFETGARMEYLGKKLLKTNCNELTDALLSEALYSHQEDAIRAVFQRDLNIVVATGTASGKTECFLYPILLDLYKQYLSGTLVEPGVRALILYPMNALANDQQQRLGEICDTLSKIRSAFGFTFGQYTGQTPENKKDYSRNAPEKLEKAHPGEIVFREDMRATPPHILLTNFSMLEYLLIRPKDVKLFDDGRGKHWKYLVLDEAHQYKGAKGMEVGMLMRRLKQRVKQGGREKGFRCISTSATLASEKSEIAMDALANFASELFGEMFHSESIIFDNRINDNETSEPKRYHAFFRALEGAFLLNVDGEDKVVLNRKIELKNGRISLPLELALCKSCGQHYYVGKCKGGVLKEAIRDPSHEDFGVEYYLPSDEGKICLCRVCGRLEKLGLNKCCDIETINVLKCETHQQQKDKLKKCENCGYSSGPLGDPVQEIVYGNDGPNAVIATSLHRLLPEKRRKVLTFADSRQEAALFAWYAQDSYEKIRDRNYIARVLEGNRRFSDGLSIEDVAIGLQKIWEENDESYAKISSNAKWRRALAAILREAVTNEGRVSMSGIGLLKWSVNIPGDLDLSMFTEHPWNFSMQQSEELIQQLLNEIRQKGALALPETSEDLSYPAWSSISDWPQRKYCLGKPNKRKNVSQWGGRTSVLVTHYMMRQLKLTGNTDVMTRSDAIDHAAKLLVSVWSMVRNCFDDDVLKSIGGGLCQLNTSSIRLKLPTEDEIWECDVCATISNHNVNNVCPRKRCKGWLKKANLNALEENHYRKLYLNNQMPFIYRSEEHTAQIAAEEAEKRQKEFKENKISLLSTSTTFEVGVDLGDLDVVFLRNVPPETFNYIQRAGRAGRRSEPGVVITYCGRNPHDLYHYAQPEERIINAEIRPLKLEVKNRKIILRHIVAVVLSEFFKSFEDRFKNVATFIGDWSNPHAVSDLYKFCSKNMDVQKQLMYIVPSDMHEKVGMFDNSWLESIAGDDSKLAVTQDELCNDYKGIQSFLADCREEDDWNGIKYAKSRLMAIASESTLDFLSRKAIIPKYGFPVDVVELDIHERSKKRRIVLQRDLSQAVAEYAPGGSVVANKLEWKSYGLKIVSERELQTRYYSYSGDARTFKQYEEHEISDKSNFSKYRIPEHGFVTQAFKEVKEPSGRVGRMYTTRPFFIGFNEDQRQSLRHGVYVTKAVPGRIVVLCEGKTKEGFRVCNDCGAQMTQHSMKKDGRHETPYGKLCNGTFGRYSLGHVLETDVMSLCFPELENQWSTYSVAYAILLGAAEVLGVPSSDLNVTIASGSSETKTKDSAIVLYDDVPGGAGLVTQLERDDVLLQTLEMAARRVNGCCECDMSCYGCLRSYRNQFAHAELNRREALRVLKEYLTEE